MTVVIEWRRRERISVCRRVGEGDMLMSKVIKEERAQNRFH